MSEESDYNLGYFEVIRNVFMAFMQAPDEKSFLEWLETELADARRLRDDE